MSNIEERCLEVKQDCKNITKRIFENIASGLIKLSILDIPDWLHKSPVYLSLVENDEDEHIEVPNNIKLDTRIMNIKEYVKFFETIRFFSLPEKYFPETFVYFTTNNPKIVIEFCDEWDISKMELIGIIINTY